MFGFYHVFNEISLFFFFFVTLLAWKLEFSGEFLALNDMFYMDDTMKLHNITFTMVKKEQYANACLEKPGQSTNILS